MVFRAAALPLSRPSPALNGTGFANGQPLTIPVGTGAPAASFLFGGMDFVNFGYPIESAYRWWQTGLFFQDDWRVTPNLTLNLGLRWDLQIPRTDAHGEALHHGSRPCANPDAGNIPGAFTFYGNGSGRNGRPRIGNIDYKGVAAPLRSCLLARRSQDGPSAAASPSPVRSAMTMSRATSAAINTPAAFPAQRCSVGRRMILVARLLLGQAISGQRRCSAKLESESRHLRGEYKPAFDSPQFRHSAHPVVLVRSNAASVHATV